MFDIDIAVMRGFGVGFNYTNEDIEGIETIADDLRHTIQVIFFFVIINITYYTHREF
tara:strand:+ start:66 stop:236 length:171 start_codon:yes stop_codon:yes gene_type:complete